MGDRRQRVNMAPRGNKKLAEFIKQRRAAIEITQKELAGRINQQFPDKFNYADTSVSHWENVDDPVFPPLFDPDFMQALATALDTEPYWIVEAAGWLKGVDVPVNSAYINFIKLLEKASPYERQLIEQVLKSVVNH